MLVRNLLSLSILAMSAVGFSQSAGLEVQTGYSRMAGKSTLEMTLTGVEMIGRIRKNVVVNTRFLSTVTSSGKPLMLVEIVEKHDRITVRRIVGDGTSLWSYDPAKNEYRVSDYGTLSGTNTNYAGNFMSLVGSMSEGFAVYPVRFLRDIYHVAGPRFQNWIPGVTGQMVYDGQPAVFDPINTNRRYLADPGRYFATFWNTTNANRSLAFEFLVNQNGGNDLAFAYYSESSRSRFIDFQVEFLSGGAFAPGTFVFVPPTNARPITGPKAEP